MKFATTILFASLIVFSGCNASDPEDNKAVRLPFTHVILNFAMTTEELQDGNSNGYSWSYWITYDGENDENVYHYWWYDRSETFSDLCEVSSSRTANQLSITYSCFVPRQGNVNPNNGEWKNTLQYEVTIQANIQDLEVTKAKLAFPDFNQVLDLTDGMSIDVLSDHISFDFDQNISTNDNYSISLNFEFSEITDLESYLNQ